MMPFMIIILKCSGGKGSSHSSSPRKTCVVLFTQVFNLELCNEMEIEELPLRAGRPCPFASLAYYYVCTLITIDLIQGLTRFQGPSTWRQINDKKSPYAESAHL
jgi:hypothetical protein